MLLSVVCSIIYKQKGLEKNPNAFQTSWRKRMEMELPQKMWLEWPIDSQEETWTLMINEHKFFLKIHIVNSTILEHNTWHYFLFVFEVCKTYKNVSYFPITSLVEYRGWS
jgi:hypothetical protein